MQSLPSFVWGRIRRPLIAAAVISHFAIGVLCFADTPSALLEIRPVALAVGEYRNLGFAQTWRMFAPPAQSIDQIGHSLRFDEGWTELVSIADIAAERARGDFILPRGQLRLSNQLRHPNLTRSSLDDEPYFRHYFQQLAAFYCFGDGAIPNLRAIRFYSVIKPIEPFFPPEDPDKPVQREPVISAIYQRECSDR
jgi:hypothetical protein